MPSALELKYAKLAFGLSISERRRLWMKLSKLIGNGVPILQGLESIYKNRVATGSTGHPQTIALAEWMKGMRNGSRLGEVINGWVSHDERMLISAGEQSGTVEKALLSAAKVINARSQINGAVFKGLAYPIVLIALAFGVLYMFGFKIVPAFSKIAPPEKWHGLARSMIEVSLFAQHWLWLISLLVVAMVTAFFFSLERWDGQVRIKVDQYAPYSVYRIMQGSTWLISFSALIEAGMRIETALQQLAETASPWLKARINGCLRGTRSGLNVGEALTRAGYGFPDREIINDLGVYSSLSGFDSALATLGNEWLDESVVQIKARMGVVFGVSILLVGLLVAFMVAGMMDMELQMAALMKSH